MKLTLRELFLLVVIAAMGCGWWVERSRMRSQILELQYQLIDEITKDVTGESPFFGEQPVNLVHERELRAVGEP